MEESSPRAPAHIELSSLLSESWALFTRQPGVHVLAFLIVTVGGSLTLGLATAPLLVGYLRMLDRARAGESIAVGDVLEGLSSFGSAFFAALITAVAMTIGFALIVLPGVVVAVVWSYGLWFVALEGKGAVDALSASWDLARRQAGSLLLVLLAVVALNFVGSLLVVGIVVTGPLALIFMTLGFRELNQA